MSALRRGLNKKTIPYRKELNSITGCVLGSILMQQISFLSEIKDDQPFYKFKMPCNHKLYISGDSWTEELGFSRREFERAFKSIGQKIKSGQKKDENVFVWSWTDHNRVTWYQLNVKFYEAQLEKAYPKKQASETNKHKSTDRTLAPELKRKVSFTKSTDRTLHKKSANRTLYITENTTDKTTEIKKPAKKKIEEINYFKEFLEIYGSEQTSALSVAWCKVAHEEHPRILSHLRQYIKTTEPKFVVMPVKYLKQEYWKMRPLKEKKKQQVQYFDGSFD